MTLETQLDDILEGTYEREENKDRKGVAEDADSLEEKDEGGTEVDTSDESETLDDGEEVQEELGEEEQEEKEEQEEQPAKDKKAKRVPLPELIEERRKRQEVEAQLKAVNDELSAIKPQLQKLQQFQVELQNRQQPQPKQEPEPEAPDYYADPEAYIRYQENRVQKALEQTNSTVSNMRGELENRAFMDAIGGMEQRFMQENADYPQALMHIRSIMKENLKDAGVTDEKEQLNMIFAAEVQNAKALMQRGLDPVAHTYKIAERMGYRKAESKEEDKKPADDAAAKLKNVKEGQERNKRNGGTVTTGSSQPADDDELFDAAKSEAFSYLRKN